jgi:hypothetical protein
MDRTGSGICRALNRHCSGGHLRCTSAPGPRSPALSWRKEQTLRWSRGPFGETRQNPWAARRHAAAPVPLEVLRQPPGSSTKTLPGPFALGTSYSASFYMHVRLVVNLEPSVLELAITDRVEVTSQFDQSLAIVRHRPYHGSTRYQGI